MHLYLMQHGLAAAKADDAERPLTPEGREETERIAAWWSGHLTRGAELRILHSGKLRARQTAELVGIAVGAHGIPAAHDGLAPNDDPCAVAATLDPASDPPTLLVGHLPHLSRLAALLLTGDGARETVLVRNSGLIALVHNGAGWRLRFAVPATLLPTRLPPPATGG